MLVLFDVDGTLTRTGALDAEVYARVFAEVFGRPLPTTEWSEYAHATDRGVAEEAVRALRLDPGRLGDFERRFVAEIRLASRRRDARPVPGAIGIVGRLTAAGHAVAFATGALEHAARAKLEAAGIDIREQVLVGSDFDPSREEIVREAMRRRGAQGRAVYVGDGLWDARAARALHLPFVGVDPERTGALRNAGTSHVVEDYRDFPAFLAAISDANVPTIVL